MATTDHPLVIDLGKVRGLSAYEQWLTIEGNEGKSFDDFLRYLASLIGLDIDTTDTVTEGDTALITSGGVWTALRNLGLFDEDGGGSAHAASAKSYVLGDQITPADGEDLSPWISASGSVWTLAPNEGQEWFIRNGGDTSRTLTVSLPDSAMLGAHIRVHFEPSGSATCSEITIQSGGMKLFGEATPATIGGVTLFCTMGEAGWVVIRHYATNSTGPVATERHARIVYSGANRSATASTSYTATVAWTGDAATKTSTLRKDIFRKLYNTASFRGWTTSKTGTSVVYADGATVTVSDNQTLTLYPLYTESATVVSAAADALWGGTTAGTREFFQTALTFKPSSYISGFKEGTVKVRVWGQVRAENNHPCGIGGSATSKTPSSATSLPSGSTAIATLGSNQKGATTAGAQTFTVGVNSSGQATVYVQVYGTHATFWAKIDRIYVG